jgi:hypothetical protein
MAVLRTRARYYSAGHPREPPDALLASRFGSNWPVLAGHRVGWSASVKDVVAPFLPASLLADPILCRLGIRVPLVGRLPPLQFTFLDYISNRHADMLYSASMLGQCRVLFFSDDSAVVNGVLGRRELPDEDQIFIRQARWVLYGLQNRWRCIPLAPGESELVHLAPKGCNWFATWACEFLRASGGYHFIHWRHADILIQMSHASFELNGFVVSAKGTFVDGRGYASACVQFINAEGIYECVCFGATRLKAVSLRQAEFEALLFAQRLFIQAVLRLQLVQSLEVWADDDLNGHLGLANFRFE